MRRVWALQDLDQVLEKQARFERESFEMSSGQVDEADGKDSIKKSRKDCKEALKCFCDAFHV